MSALLHRQHHFEISLRLSSTCNRSEHDAVIKLLPFRRAIRKSELFLKDIEHLIGDVHDQLCFCDFQSSVSLVDNHRAIGTREQNFRDAR